MSEKLREAGTVGAKPEPPMEAHDDPINRSHAADLIEDLDRNGLLLSIVIKHFLRWRASLPSPAPQVIYPLNVEGLKELAEEWAKDDRLWTTQETVAFNLATFGRKVLSLLASSPAQPVGSADKEQQ